MSSAPGDDSSATGESSAATGDDSGSGEISLTNSSDEAGDADGDEDSDADSSTIEPERSATSDSLDDVDGSTSSISVTSPDGAGDSLIKGSDDGLADGEAGEGSTDSSIRGSEGTHGSGTVLRSIEAATFSAADSLVVAASDSAEAGVLPRPRPSTRAMATPGATMREKRSEPASDLKTAMSRR